MYLKFPKVNAVKLKDSYFRMYIEQYVRWDLKCKYVTTDKKVKKILPRDLLKIEKDLGESLHQTGNTQEVLIYV